jgi:hypothetical protein
VVVGVMVIGIEKFVLLPVIFLCQLPGAYFPLNTLKNPVFLCKKIPMEYNGGKKNRAVLELKAIFFSSDLFTPVNSLCTTFDEFLTKKPPC